MVVLGRGGAELIGSRWSAVIKELVFAFEEYAVRLAQVRARMRALDVDVFLSHTPENLTYLSGYRTPVYYRYQCLAVAHVGDPVLLIRHIEAINVAIYSWFDRCVVWKDTEDYIEATAKLLEDMGAAGRRREGLVVPPESGLRAPCPPDARHHVCRRVRHD